jgi:hypothetical protein
MAGVDSEVLARAPLRGRVAVSPQGVRTGVVSFSIGPPAQKDCDARHSQADVATGLRSRGHGGGAGDDAAVMWGFLCRPVDLGRLSGFPEHLIHA